MGGLLRHRKVRLSGSSSDKEASFPDELNAFYAHYDRENTDVPSWPLIAPDGIAVQRPISEDPLGEILRKGVDRMVYQVTLSKLVQSNWL